ncbi:MAG: hypothetical protein M3O09_16975 [Acidobacteriota bacterium]|nr:hypothetical protein [Acidobacteriota bacterium]
MLNFPRPLAPLMLSRLRSRFHLRVAGTFLILGALANAGVFVSAPSNGATVSTTIQYVATANAACGVSAMGIYTAPYQLAATSSGAKLNTLITLPPGTYHTVVQEWDNCGGSSKTPIDITVGGGGGGGGTPPPQGKTFYELQRNGGQWQGFGMLKPNYMPCTNCWGPVTWWMGTGVSSPSRSGNSTKTSIAGNQPYNDAFWNNHLIGDFSTQGLPDTNHTLAPSLHDFTYDVWFFAPNVGAAEALEFDINQFVNGQAFIWGHECRVAGGHQWDIWDNVHQHWTPTGIPCNPNPNAWNHLVIHSQRTTDNHLLFKSITLNGQTSTLNRYDSPIPTTWYGITINYQIDGNSWQQPYDVWLDDLNFTYF